MENTKVFVGLSGGVDSSVAAKRLIEQGYAVTGVFIKTWHPDFLPCTEESDRRDAMRVAAHLGIPFLTCDAVETYKRDVADYMIREYSSGRTPNPDVMCNRFVKFGAFLDFAKAHGASYVATGHYAQVSKSQEVFHLRRGADTNKDQSYFLWTLTQEQLAHTLFPIGDSTKPIIRIEAEKAKLPTFAKKDSQGICFLGEVDIKEFLSHYIKTTPGNILNTKGDVIGEHEGAIFYTIGQRHGFAIKTVASESIPYYIVSKNLGHNTVTVSEHQEKLDGETIVLTEFNLIQTHIPDVCDVQFRYRQKPFKATLTIDSNKRGVLKLCDGNIELPSRGQSCVIYSESECIGGGIINEII